MNDGFPDASPPNPREERFRPLGEFLYAEAIAVVTLAVAALLARQRIADASGAAMIGLLIIVPLVIAARTFGGSPESLLRSRRRYFEACRRRREEATAGTRDGAIGH